MIPAAKFPRLPIVLAHCGGEIFAREAMVAALFCPNIYLELSSLMPHTVLEILSRIPAQRLMIGSDLPENLETEMAKILNLEAGGDVRAEILWNTARRLFDRVEKSRAVSGLG